MNESRFEPPMSGVECGLVKLAGCSEEVNVQELACYCIIHITDS